MAGKGATPLGVTPTGSQPLGGGGIAAFTGVAAAAAIALGSPYSINIPSGIGRASASAAAAAGSGTIASHGVGTATAQLTASTPAAYVHHTIGGAGASATATHNLTTIKPTAGHPSATGAAVGHSAPYAATRLTLGHAAASLSAIAAATTFKRIGVGAANATAIAAARGNILSRTGAGTATATATAAAVSTKIHPGTGTVHAAVSALGETSVTTSIGAGTASAASAAAGGGASTFHTSGVVTSALAADGFMLRTPPVTYRFGKAVTVTEGVVYAATLIAKVVVVVSDRIAFDLSATALWHANIQMNDQALFHDQVKHIISLILHEQIHLADSYVAQLTLQILDHLHLISAPHAAAQYQTGVGDTMTLGELLVAAYGLHLQDVIQAAAELTPLYHAVAACVENMLVEDTPTPKWILSGMVSEEINTTDVLSTIVKFSAVVLDLIEVASDMAEPGGSMSTWQMNTRTGAVTNYGNYNFNSFARLGLQQYIGATSDGLYQLDGPDDDGEPIVGVIRGGYLKFGGTHLSRIKAAYIAQRGDGCYLLKIVTGPGDEYIYEANTRSMETAKFSMGKGQRATYFAFELMSTGQDFDIDTIEFVPIVVQRRV